MEFIFIFAVVLPEIFFIYLFEVVEVIRAFGIDALMDDKVFAFFLWDQGIAAVGDSVVLQRRSGFHRVRTLRCRLCREAVLWNHYFYKGKASGHHSGGRYSCPEYRILTVG